MRYFKKMTESRRRRKKTYYSDKKKVCINCQHLQKYNICSVLKIRVKPQLHSCSWFEKAKNDNSQDKFSILADPGQDL